MLLFGFLYKLNLVSYNDAGEVCVSVNKTPAVSVILFLNIQFLISNVKNLKLFS